MRLAVYFLVILPCFSMVQAQVVSPKEEAALISIYSKASNDPFLGDWLTHRMNELLKHGLDKAVDKVLQENPIVQKILPDVLQLINKMIVEAQINHLKNAAKASGQVEGDGGQYQDILNMVREIARKLYFSEHAIQNVQVFVKGGPMVNAYTYSGNIQKVHLVLFAGLLNLMEDHPEALKAVIGHELGHIKSHHIRNQILLVIIFLATAENLIPSDKAKTKEKKLEKLWSKIFFQLHLDEVFEEFSFKERIQPLVKSVRDQFSPVELQKLSKNLVLTLGDLREGSESEEKPEKDQEISLKQFLMALERLSRSQETTCDRYGFCVVNSVKDAAMADVLLTGGKKATLSGTMAQQEKLDQLLLEYPQFLQDKGTHPAPGERVEQHKLFKQSDAHHILTTPFLRALNDYIALSQLIHQIDNEIQKDRDSITLLNHFAWKREKATTLAQQLKDWLMQVISKEIQTGSLESETLKAVIEEFQKQVVQQLERDPQFASSWLQNFMKPGRLLHDLKEVLPKKLQTRKFNSAYSRFSQSCARLLKRMTYSSSPL